MVKKGNTEVVLTKLIPSAAYKEVRARKDFQLTAFCKIASEIINLKNRK